MQLYSFTSEILLIGVLIKVITLINSKRQLAHHQLTQKLINGSLAFIIITAIVGALVYLNIRSIYSVNLVYIHTLFSLIAKQLAMPIVVICITKNIIESSSNQQIRSRILWILLILCLTSFIFVSLYSLPQLLYKIVDISLVVSGIFLISHAIQTSQNVLQATGAFICLMGMAALPVLFLVDSQFYVLSLHILLASYLYLLLTTE